MEAAGQEETLVVALLLLAPPAVLEPVNARARLELGQVLKVVLHVGAEDRLADGCAQLAHLGGAETLEGLEVIEQTPG